MLPCNVVGRTRINEQAAYEAARWLANMSHELRTPLNAIIGFSELMLRSMDGLSERQIAYAGDIHRSGRHLLEIVGDVLTLTGLETGSLPLVIEPVDLAALMELCADRLRTAERPMKVRLEITQIGEPFSVLGDPNAFREMFCKLIANAARSGPANAPVQVVLSGSKDGGAMVAISNTGSAARRETITHTLRPLECRDATIAQEFCNSGIGLILVKKLVELHDGVLSVHNSADNGTTVGVEFPSKRVLALEPASKAAG
ncbi:sensor histidine kinase [Dongia deserti]|uniref:sensor histidine kinase n=1 Tax=Dongia deserti TaxID=2268030 RepID=UPI000E65474F|nr:HAMP domain-containing sensor histidine kinase [Dongia deserti]